MLIYPNGESFVTSRARYSDEIQGYPGNKICIAVQFSNLPMTTAIVDTGCPWCLLSNQEAKVIDTGYRERADQEITLCTWVGKIRGVLLRWPVTLCAEEGHDREIDGTVFVPDEDVPLPNFIGLDGLLSRVRFAVDPQNNDFFFGPLQAQIL